jgi:hypothetical protein
MHGFKIVDCSLNDTNGGSFRIYLQKEIANASSFATAPLRDVCQYRVDSILSYEKNVCDISDPRTWDEFAARLAELKRKVTTFVEAHSRAGKKIYGYGASTKGNTLLQYFGLDSRLIKAIAERSPYKFGYKTIGTNIPIISEDEMREANPDFALVLPWHFISEFQMREKSFLDAGGTFIVPCPDFQLIAK